MYTKKQGVYGKLKLLVKIHPKHFIQADRSTGMILINEKCLVYKVNYAPISKRKYCQ